MANLKESSPDKSMSQPHANAHVNSNANDGSSDRSLSVNNGDHHIPQADRSLWGRPKDRYAVSDKSMSVNQYGPW